MEQTGEAYEKMAKYSEKLKMEKQGLIIFFAGLSLLIGSYYLTKYINFIL